MDCVAKRAFAVTQDDRDTRCIRDGEIEFPVVVEIGRRDKNGIEHAAIICFELKDTAALVEQQ